MAHTIFCKRVVVPVLFVESISAPFTFATTSTRHLAILLTLLLPVLVCFLFLVYCAGLAADGCLRTWCSCSTLLAITSPPSMLTDTASSTLLAHTAPPPVLTDTASSTVLAFVALPPVLTDTAPTTLLAYTALPPMLTDTASSTLLALIAPPSVLTRGCWHADAISTHNSCG